MVENKGWIKLYRQIIESEIFKKPPLYLKVWIYLLSRAQHKDFKDLKRGELWTSVPEIQEACSWYVGYRKVTPTYKEVYSVIQWLREPHERIYERTTNGNTNGNMIVTTKATQGMLIKIENYNVYQEPKNYEGNTEGNYERTTKELRTELEGNNINKNDKECNKNDKKNIYSSIIDYLNKKAGTRYRSATKKTQSYINARINEGFKEIDFYTVIDNKVAEWKDTTYEKYLRPSTLFGTKFEEYLNQKSTSNKTNVNSQNNNNGWNGYKKFK